MKKFLIIFTVFFFSCTNDVPDPNSEDLFDNPLDAEEAEYDLPALTFFPVEINATAGGIFIVDIFPVPIYASLLMRIGYNHLPLYQEQYFKMWTKTPSFFQR